MMPLALLVLLSACAKTEPPAPIAIDRLCEGWKHQTIRKADKLTDETASGIEGNNKSRDVWGCQYGQNKAKDGANG
jgi:hypothetical protein